MTFPVGPAVPAPGGAVPAARRIEVYVCVPGPDGAPLLVGGDTPRVPGAVLGHGEEPRAAAVRALAALPPVAGGPPAPDRLRLRQVRSDVRAEPGGPDLHVVRLVLAPPDAPHDAPHAPGAGAPGPGLLRDPEPPPAGDRQPGGPPQVQRLAAYAVVVREGEVLLTRVTGSGVWTLPGGGVDHGEHPDDAVRRETVEESGLELTATRLLDVGSRHFTGHSPDQVLEDFHAVRIRYTGEVAGRAEPQVQEVGGTTDAAAWVPLDRVGGLRLADVVRDGLRARAEQDR